MPHDFGITIKRDRVGGVGSFCEDIARDGATCVECDGVGAALCLDISPDVKGVEVDGVCPAVFGLDIPTDAARICASAINGIGGVVALCEDIGSTSRYRGIGFYLGVII